MKIPAVGPHRLRCRTTEKNVRDAYAALNLSADIARVWDVKEFVKLGVTMTAAVIVDSKIIIFRKGPHRRRT